MKAAISGSSGLVGTAVSGMLSQEGYELIALGREDLYGSVEKLADKLRGVQVVIHLAGAPIQQRWTKKNRKKIYDSRVKTTRHLVQAMGMLENKPQVFMCASAATLYPEQGIHTEQSKAVAPSFLGDVARDWEAEAAKAAPLCRTLHLRFGVVLSSRGGALKTMLPPFRLGVGGRVGSGQQMISWIHLDDVTGAVKFAMGNKNLAGPVNITAPNPVTNAEFSKVLAQTIHRPSFNRVPPFLLKIFYGKGARVVIRGVTVLPAKLVDAGYGFRFPQIKVALQDLL